MKKVREPAMIAMEAFHREDGSPIYQQIVLYLKRGAASGAIVSGDELPSRRVLSALLGVNPNTVQKAYRLLEEEGLVRSHSGSKSCMVFTEEQTARICRELLEYEGRRVVSALAQLGLSKEEALTLIDQYWEPKEEAP